MAKGYEEQILSLIEGGADLLLIETITDTLNAKSALWGAWEAFDFPPVPHGARIRAVPRAVIDYLHGRRGPLATAEEGRVCVEMILGAYRAAREGARVTFPL